MTLITKRDILTEYSNYDILKNNKSGARNDFCRISKECNRGLLLA